MQVMIVPISQASQEYAEQVRSRIRGKRFFVDVDHSDSKMEKKIRDAQLAQYNYILVRSPVCFSPVSPQLRQDQPLQALLQVVGEQESSRNTVNVRTRDNQRRGEHSLETVLSVIQEERASRCGAHYDFRLSGDWFCCLRLC